MDDLHARILDAKTHEHGAHILRDISHRIRTANHSGDHMAVDKLADDLVASVPPVPVVVVEEPGNLTGQGNVTLPSGNSTAGNATVLTGNAMGAQVTSDVED